MPDRVRPLSGKRYRVRSADGALLKNGPAPESPVLQMLAPGRTIVCAEARQMDSGGWLARISSPAGWLAAEDLEPAPPAASPTLDFETFRSRHREVAPGDHYGLDFPFTMDMLLAFGPSFLTDAFRAAGTISANNAVTRIVELKPLGKFGASDNAFLTVAYRTAEPGLAEKLFVKFPPLEEGLKFALAPMARNEILMHGLFRDRPLPVPMAKYHYAEYSTRTTNYMLVTERIPFGEPPTEPAYTKGWDHLLPDVEGHYAVLVRAQARLAAAHKRGALGDDIEDVFPFAQAARTVTRIDDPEGKVDLLVDFVFRVAPQLFAEPARSHAFMARWREDVLLGLRNQEALIGFLHREVDYVSFCHLNLNPDNAWFWRDGDGQLHAGLLDWGGVGQMSVAQALGGMLMMADPERYLSLSGMALDVFIREYADLGGPLLDRNKLRRQYKAAVYLTSLTTIVDIVANLLPGLPEGDYRTMENRFDDRLLDSGLYAAIAWIDDMLREWSDDLTPGDVCRQIVGLQGDG